MRANAKEDILIGRVLLFGKYLYVGKIPGAGLSVVISESPYQNKTFRFLKYSWKRASRKSFRVNLFMAEKPWASFSGSGTHFMNSQQKCQQFYKAKP